MRRCRSHDNGRDQASGADPREAAIGDAVDVAERLDDGAIIDRGDGGAQDDGAEDGGAVVDAVGENRKLASISMGVRISGFPVG